MTRYSLFALLLSVIIPLQFVEAQAPEPTMVVVGTVIQSPVDGSDWAYLSWLASNASLLRDRSYSVYMKSGGTDSPDSYVLAGTLAPQWDTSVISMLFNRSRHLGQNLPELQQAVQAYFDQYAPGAGVSPEDMFSVLVAQSFESDEIFAMLTFLGRAHPGAALALGTGFAVRIPSGDTTFELRECLPGTNDCTSVIGRITVQAGQPVRLNPPEGLVEVPNTSSYGEVLPLSHGTNHMNVKLRWITPEVLREQALLLRGYDVYRVTRAYAEARGWDACPAPSALSEIDWQQEVQSAFPEVAKVNRLPILPRKFYSLADVSDFTPGNIDFYTQDDNRHNGLTFDVDGEPMDVHNLFVAGAEFYYYAVAVDILGRNGHPSCGKLLRICDRAPPVAPKSVQVTNNFVFNSGSQTSDQRLRISWRQLPDSEGVVAYYVYRWRSLTELRAFELEDPLNIGPANRVAGPIAHVSGQQRLAVIDNADAIHSPSLSDDPTYGAVGDDAGATFWYTVVAVDDSVCGGNFSPHSAPGYGVLRDRVPPKGGGGEIQIRCCLPIMEVTRASHATTEGPLTQDPTTIAFDLTVERGPVDPGELVWVEFWLENVRDGSVDWIDVVEFPANATDFLRVQTQLPKPEDYDGPWLLHAKVQQSDGRYSNQVTETVASGLVRTFHRGGYLATRDCRQLAVRGEDDTCRVHQPVDPQSDDINPINIDLQFALSTREWRVYRTIDAGPLVLIKQGLLDAPPGPGEILSIQDALQLVQGAEICYFVQYFDEHGNGGPVLSLGCLELPGKPPPTPTLARAQSLETNGQYNARLRWFCPPTNVERFEVVISRGMDKAPPAMSQQLTSLGMNSSTFLDDNGVTITGRMYETGVVGAALQANGPEFTVLLDNIDPDTEYRIKVRAVSMNGLKSEYSNAVSFTWNSVDEIILPEVDWPARPLPPLMSQGGWDSRIKAEFLANLEPGYLRAGVRIGQLLGDRSCVPTPDGFDPNNPVFVLFGNVDPAEKIFPKANQPPPGPGEKPKTLLPVMLYRYQVSNSLYPEVSNDIVQVTPLIEQIPHLYYSTIGDPFPICSGTRLFDPYIAVTLDRDEGLSSVINDIWLLDSMPVNVGARYAYLLAVFQTNGELAYIIPAGEVDISLNP